MPSKKIDPASRLVPLLVVRLEPGKGHRLEVADVARRILTMFPGSRILAEDSFEAERQRLKGIEAELRKTGKSTRGFNLMLDSIESKELALGPGKDLSIPLDSGNQLIGHVWARSALFSAKNCQLPNKTIDQLVNLLESLQAGPVEIDQFGKSALTDETDKPDGLSPRKRTG